MKIPKRIVNLEREIREGEFYKILAAFIMISLIIIVSIFLIRNAYFNDVPPGYQTYYNLLLSENIPESMIQYDSGLTQKRISFYEPGYFLLNAASKITTLEYSSTGQYILLYLLSMINMVLFVMIVKKFTKDLITIFATGLFFITSPQFIYLPTTLNPAVFINFLMLLIVFLLIKYEESDKRAFLAPIIIFLTILVSITNIVNYIAISIIALGFFSFINKTIRKKEIYYIIFIISVITFIFFNYEILKHADLGIFFNNYNLLQNKIFTEMGAFLGIRIVDLFLSIIGISLIWNVKKHYITSILAVLLIFFSFKIYDFYAIIFPIFAIFCGISYATLTRMKWDLGYIKKLCVIIIVIFTLISCVQYIISFGFDEPFTEKYVAFKHLSREGTSGAVVFSSQNNGFMIESISRKKAVLDNNLNGIENASLILKEHNSIMLSRNLNTIKKYLERYNVTYVVIDQEMKENLWNSRIDGMYFVIKNSDSFKMIYDKKNIEIYQFINSTSQ